MEAPDAADIADNTYFLRSVMYHDKDSIFCLTLQSSCSKKKKKTEHDTQKILNMSVSPLFLNLLELVRSTAYAKTTWFFLLPISVPHAAVTQELSSLFPKTFEIQISAGIFWCVTLHGTFKSCLRREGTNPFSDLSKSFMKLLDTEQDTFLINFPRAQESNTNDKRARVTNTY